MKLPSALATPWDNLVKFESDRSVAADMDTIEIIHMEITNQGLSEVVDFFKAELVVVTELGYRNWYVDVSGIRDPLLLDRFSDSDDIRVEMKLRTADGDVLNGDGYFHPNVTAAAAAVRGEGVLHGYEDPSKE
ncbi:hypothetical protein [Paenibacillus gansuensis]|uniref:Uncharacterized protein n=1 Tax=Paenibacillus gansuensis TaxID=306542 RepID=A0ABW5P8Y3_9BACL